MHSSPRGLSVLPSPFIVLHPSPLSTVRPAALTRRGLPAERIAGCGTNV